MAEHVERRRHRRLSLRFPLFLSGEGPSGQFVEHTTTENVSGGGLFFLTSAWKQMPVGTRLHVYIEVPSHSALFAHHTRLKSVGRVVRTTDGNGDGLAVSRGVAVQFENELRFTG